MKKMKAMIFDFNGTMFWDNEYHEQAWEKITLEIRHTPLTQQEAIAMHGCNNTKILAMLLGRELDETEARRISQRKEALYRDICLAKPTMFHLSPGCEQVLQQLKQAQIPMTIASAAIRENIDFYVKEFQLERWIDAKNIVCDNGCYENKVGMFLQAAKLLKQAPNDCIVVEDSNAGIAYAKAAGIGMVIGIGVKERHEEMRKQGADTVIESFQAFCVETYFKSSRILK